MRLIVCRRTKHDGRSYGPLWRWWHNSAVRYSLSCVSVCVRVYGTRTLVLMCTSANAFSYNSAKTHVWKIYIENERTILFGVLGISASRHLCNLMMDRWMGMDGVGDIAERRDTYVPLALAKGSFDNTLNFRFYFIDTLYSSVVCRNPFRHTVRQRSPHKSSSWPRISAFPQPDSCVRVLC